MRLVLILLIAALSFTQNAVGENLFSNAAFIQGTYNGSMNWGDYDNDGDPDLLVTGYRPTNQWIAEIYRNNGDGTLQKLNYEYAPLAGVQAGTGLWGDLDNDGFADIVIAGHPDGQDLVRIYRNNGNGTFSLWNSSLPGYADPSLALADYDKDGLLDILIGGGGQTSVYRNTGGGQFAIMNFGLAGIYVGSVSWLDFDKDGKLDIFVCGGDSPMLNNTLSRLYRGNGSSFEQVTITLPGFMRSSVDWGDYDNDGDVDLLVTGAIAANTPTSRVYRNDGGGTFIDINALLGGVMLGDARWVDYDNDSLPDIILTGYVGYNDYITRIYRNDGMGAFWDTYSSDLPGLAYSSVSAADYNLDGSLDLAVMGLAFGNVYTAGVFKNELKYQLSGFVSDGINALPGVTVNMSGAGGGSTATNIAGGYSFVGVPSGTYELTPVKPPYIFAPSSRIVSVFGHSKTGLDFIASLPTPSPSTSPSIEPSASPTPTCEGTQEQLELLTLLSKLRSSVKKLKATSTQKSVKQAKSAWTAFNAKIDSMAGQLAYKPSADTGILQKNLLLLKSDLKSTFAVKSKKFKKSRAKALSGIDVLKVFVSC